MTPRSPSHLRMPAGSPLCGRLEAIEGTGWAFSVAVHQAWAWAARPPGTATSAIAAAATTPRAELRRMTKLRITRSLLVTPTEPPLNSQPNIFGVLTVRNGCVTNAQDYDRDRYSITQPVLGLAARVIPHRVGQDRTAAAPNPVSPSPDPTRADRKSTRLNSSH